MIYLCCVVFRALGVVFGGGLDKLDRNLKIYQPMTEALQVEFTNSGNLAIELSIG